MDKFGICCRKRPVYLCAFTKIRFDAVSNRFFFKKLLQSGAKSGMLYPSGTGLGYIFARMPGLPAQSRRRSAQIIAIFFIYLLIIYPACPQGRKRRPNLHGPSFFVGGRSSLSTKTGKIFWESCRVLCLQGGANGSIIQPRQASACHPPRQGGRRFAAGADVKINRVRLCALSAASTGSCAADEGEVFPRCTACIPLLHGLGRGPQGCPAARV